MAVSQEPWEYVAGDLERDDADFAALRAHYRGEIAYLDERLADLRTSLREAGEWEDTLLVVTSDHGENIGDYGLMDHQYCLYGTLLHVPLVVRGGPFADGGVDDRLTSLLDLVPTLFDVANLDAPALAAQAQGRSLVGVYSEPREHAFAEYLASQSSMDALESRVGDVPPSVRAYDRSLRAVRMADWKLVRGSDGSRECYDLGVDPGETDEISDSAPDRVGSLEDALDAWLDSFEHADPEGSVSISSATKDRLEDLGYLQE